MRRILVAMVLFLAYPFGAAQAAPQMLALFATGATPTELNCENGVCSARFSAFCLQQHRDAPLNGEAYEPMEGSDLRFVVTDANGVSRTLPARDMTIRSARHYTAVVISVPEEVVRSLGAAKIALAVGARVTLAPRALSTDPQPQTAKEIAQATGPHRALGESYVEQGGDLSKAARVAMRMINTLQGSKGTLEAEQEAALARRVLDRTALPGKAQDMMANRVDICATLAQSAWFKGGLATCLQSYHDSFVSTLNTDFWAALGAGS